VSPLFDREKRTQLFTQEPKEKEKSSQQTERTTDEISTEKKTSLMTPLQDETRDREKIIIKPTPQSPTPQNTPSTSASQKPIHSVEPKITTVESKDSSPTNLTQTETSKEYNFFPYFISITTLLFTSQNLSSLDLSF
jgi:hypothetical protein